MIKKIFAWLLTFVLLVQPVFPALALAQEEVPPATESAEIAAAPETPEPTPTPALTPTPTPIPTPTPTPTPQPEVLAETTETSGVSLTTGKFDYFPTETVDIYGTGLLSVAVYNLFITSSDEPALNFSAPIITDNNGSFTYYYQLDGNYRPNYKVELKNGNEDVVVSTTFTDAVSKPTAPDMQSPVVNSTSSVTLNWKDKSDDEDDFHLSRKLSGQPDSTYTPITTITTQDKAGKDEIVSYTDSGLSCYTDYVYSIKAHRHSDGIYSNDNTTSPTTLYLSTTSVTDLTPTTALSGSSNVSLISFTLTSCRSNAKINDVKIQYTGTNKADITSIKLYKESGSVPGSFDSGSDTLLGTDTTSTDTGEYSINISSPDLTIGTSTMQFYVTADLKVTATIGNTVDVRILQGKIDITDNPDHTIGSENNWPLGSELATWNPDGSSTIVATNVAPSFDAIANQTVDENSSSQNVPITNVLPGPSDESSQIVTMSATSSDPTIVPNPSVSGSGSTRTLTYAPAINKFGTVTITVTANDGQSENNTYSRTFSITVNQDTTPPETTIDSGPTGYVSNTSATFAFSANETSTFQCQIDGGGFSTCSSSKIYSELAEGLHTFDVQATDTAGNPDLTPASRTWTVDTVPPIISASVTQDLNGDGKIDAIKLTFDENIKDSQLIEDTADGWDVVGAGGELIGTGDTENDNILLLIFGQGPTPDTGNTPTVTYAPTGGPGSTHDLAGNELSDYSGASTDKASPVLLSSSTRDTDANGHIDQIVTKFSENLDGDTVSMGNFSVAGYDINNISVSNNEVTLSLDEKSFNDVGSKPSVSVSTNEDDESIQDPAGNTAVDKTVTALDESAPLTIITTPANDSIYNSPINISGRSSDGQGDTVSYTRLYYRTNGEEEEWIEIPDSQRNNESGEPFDWSFDWTPSSDGIYDIKAEATDDADNVENSPTVTHVTYDSIAPTEPVATPGAGDYTSDQSVTLTSSDATSEYSIYYTTDGTTPTNADTLYAGAITVNHDMTIKAIAYDGAENASSVLSATYGVPPVISAEASSSVTDTSTTITWTTDDPSTSRVIYDTVSHPVLGEGANYGYASSTSTFDEDPKVTSHSVGISGLTAGTTYYYRTISHGSPEAVSDEKSFATSSSSSSGGGTSGDGGGGAVSAPSCNDTKPGGAPTLLSAIAGVNGVTLNWSKAVDPVSYYLVTYGLGAGLQQYGNPNVGGSDTTSYTVAGLSGGTRYYFRVRAGNGCAPGAFSNELSARPTGGVVTTVPEGFEAGVLGETTEAGNPTPTPTAETTPFPTSSVKGASTTNNWIWWILAILALILGGVGMARLWKRSDT